MSEKTLGDNPEIKKYRNVIIKLGKIEFLINPIFFSIFIGVLLFIIGVSPLILSHLIKIILMNPLALLMI